MREIFAGDGFELPDTGIPGKGLENYSSVKIEGFSPSMKLILNILENHGPLTQKTDNTGYTSDCVKTHFNPPQTPNIPLKSVHKFTKKHFFHLILKKKSF
jgi:hypothetical protein